MAWKITNHCCTESKFLLLVLIQMTKILALNIPLKMMKIQLILLLIHYMLQRMDRTFACNQAQHTC